MALRKGFKKNNSIHKAVAILFCVFISSCTGVPAGIVPVTGFDLDSYLGTWYEIARLDNRFEAGMSQVTANYSMNPDGSVRVVNRGFVDNSQSWEEAVGIASFVENPNSGHLKVSFFGPFYSSYVVFKLTPDYSLSYVTGNDRNYLWLLSRTPQVDESSKTAFIAEVRELGFAYEDILWVDQSMNIK